MADGWRPLVVSGVVVAVIVGAANRDVEPTDGQAAAAAEQPAAAEPNEAEPTAEQPAAVPGGDSDETSAPPVAAVDDIGTRRLTGHEDGRTVALTFDDGPHPKYTERVLTVLRDKGVTATFCVVGNQAVTYPELIETIVEDGHVLCNHTVSHDMSLRFKRESVIAAEFDDTQAAIVRAAPDADIRYFRAPGGYFAENLNQVATDRGLTTLGWSVDSNDWRKPGAGAIRDTVLSQVHPGAIVLLHDGGGDRSQTVSALPEIIDELDDRGYTFVVPEP
jgi:peptidoglycan/xylan/chitin deacetylase (PgdA/CDA1 family)